MSDTIPVKPSAPVVADADKDPRQVAYEERRRTWRSLNPDKKLSDQPWEPMNDEQRARRSGERL